MIKKEEKTTTNPFQKPEKSNHFQSNESNPHDNPTHKSVKSGPLPSGKAKSVANQWNDFPDQAHFHSRMITGAFAILATIEPGELSKDDLYDFCFGMIQVNERFTDELTDYMKDAL